MKRLHSIISLLLAAVALSSAGTDLARTNEEQEGAIELPKPRHSSGVSVESALAQRRSVRHYAAKPVELAAVSQLLWAAQGITDPRGHRTAPSAGALYPLEVYLVVGAVSDLGPGVYHYDPRRHRLHPHITGDIRDSLSGAALEQEWVPEAPVLLVLAAAHQRTARKYGERAERYVAMEVGHAAQNIYLQAVALDLGTVMVGAFRDQQIKWVLRLPTELETLAVMPVGKPR